MEEQEKGVVRTNSNPTKMLSLDNWKIIAIYKIASVQKERKEVSFSDTKPGPLESLLWSALGTYQV